MKKLAILLGVAFFPLGTFGFDTAEIEKLSGLKGTFNEEEKVFKITLPRGDMGATVDGWKMPPFMGLTTWVAFSGGEKQDLMAMGDLTLLQDEVNPVMSALLDSGLSVTALHNHFFHDEPKVYFMHIEGEGDVKKLAGGVRAALDKIKEVRASAPQPAKSFGSGLPETNAVAAAPLVSILGGKPQEKDGMVKFVFGRKAQMPCGCEAGKEMGVNTWAAFAGTDDNAVVDGDFACLEGELQAVLRALRGKGINIVAIHNHMTGESPRYVFLHYWGRGPASGLASAIKAGLEAQAR